MEEEMKNTYSSDRGSRGLIINIISETVVRLEKNIMDCKLLRKCHKEEAPTGVIATTVQCAKGTLLSRTPNLLNLFLDDYKDAQDLGIEFHYAWLIILIALVGWGEPKYSGFYPRRGKCCTNKYMTLWHMSDAKQRKENSIIFSMYYDDMQEKIAETWRIP
jgi:hypothetical protein